MVESIGALQVFTNQKIGEITLVETPTHGNAIYRVVTDRGVYAVRFVTRNEGDRVVEYRIASVAASLGIAPRMIAFDPQKSVMVSAWIAGEHREQLRRDDLLVLAKTLRTLHGYDTQDAHFPMVPIEEIVHPDCPEIVTALSVVARYPIDRALCHHDLTPRNILWTADSAWLIDFEFAGMGDRYFDLAAVCVEFDLSREFESYWMEVYWGSVGYAPDKLHAYQTLYRAVQRQWLERHGAFDAQP